MRKTTSVAALHKCTHFAIVIQEDATVISNHPQIVHGDTHTLCFRRPTPKPYDCAVRSQPALSQNCKISTVVLRESKRRREKHPHRSTGYIPYSAWMQEITSRLINPPRSKTGYSSDYCIHRKKHDDRLDNTISATIGVIADKLRVNPNSNNATTKTQ